MDVLVVDDVYDVKNDPVDATDNGDDVDAYADLEQWYAASLPHLHSSASFAHMTDAFASSQQQITIDAQDAVVDEGLDESADEYAIDLDDDEIQAPGEPSPTEAPLDERHRDKHSEEDGGVEVREDRDPQSQALSDEASFLTFVPKKLRVVRPERDPVAVARCCDKCRSDLNGKLLVKCSTCAFRRHLYCFSPPQREHPALVALVHVPRHKRLSMAVLIAQWRCDDCVTRLGRVPSPKTRKSPTSSKKRKKLQPLVPPTMPPPTSSPSKATEFDWHTFRANKYAQVIASGEEPTPLLAFYSSTDAQLRQSLRHWEQHVHQRQQQRRQQASRLAKSHLPPPRDLKVVLSPREAAQVTASNQRHQEDEDLQQRILFDDTLHYSFDDSRPIFTTLRWRPSPPTTDDEVDKLDEQRQAEERRHEAVEQEAMEHEDDDALTPTQVQRLVRRQAIVVPMDEDPKQLTLALAACLIQRVCVRWLGNTRCHLRKQRETVELQLMQAEETMQHRRQSHIHYLIRGLRYRLQFILAIIRAQRRVHVQQQLVRLLAEAAQERAREESDREAARLNRARRRIQRFFCGRVRRYLHLKNRVMVWRIARWWKRRHYPFQFRTLAIHVRNEHRHRAARTIQQSFRAYRIYSTFCYLRERLVARRLARFLRSWLMRRLVAKERDRMAVYTTTVWLAGRVDIVAQDATLPVLLAVLGRVLYERSDFWNAAVVLERAGRLHCIKNREFRLALAHSHHMSWYASCDPHQLALAEDGYRSILTDSTVPLDAFVLQELALVRMHREVFRGSLAILAKLLELFRNDDGFPLWLLLAGVQLVQVGEYDQSVEYLSYLVDLALPEPYLERDVLALCAMSLEKTATGSSNAKEAWRAAIRRWTLDTKLTPSAGVSTSKHQRQWELLMDLAQRANDTGHYLIASQSLLYALERLGSDGVETPRAWWLLGDTFRHLGRLDLYVEATARSRESVSDEERTQWRIDAEVAATRFQNDLTTLSHAAYVSHVRGQYEASSAPSNDEWQYDEAQGDPMDTNAI